LTTTKEHAEGVVGASSELGALRDRASGTLASLFASLGFAKQESYDQLELKVAQLEHRIKLLEDREDAKAS
jgi:cell division protein FtsB